MSTVCIVQSRFGSSRLPGKAMQIIAGRPMLAHVLARAKMIRGVDRVVLATTENERDKPLVALAQQMRVDVHRGDEHDVLDRFTDIVDRYLPSVVMRVTGDCPLLDPGVCEHVLYNYKTGAPVALVYSATAPNGNYPDGLDVEVMSVDAVRTADQHARTAADREHVTRWIRRHMSVRAVHCDELRYVAGYEQFRVAHMKLSVDTADDLARVRQIFGYLDGAAVSLDATIAAYRHAFTEA